MEFKAQLIYTAIVPEKNISKVRLSFREKALAFGTPQHDRMSVTSPWGWYCQTVSVQSTLGSQWKLYLDSQNMRQAKMLQANKLSSKQPIDNQCHHPTHKKIVGMLQGEVSGRNSAEWWNALQHCHDVTRLTRDLQHPLIPIIKLNDSRIKRQIKEPRQIHVKKKAENTPTIHFTERSFPAASRAGLTKIVSPCLFLFFCTILYCLLIHKSDGKNKYVLESWKENSFQEKQDDCLLNTYQQPVEMAATSLQTTAPQTVPPRLIYVSCTTNYPLLIYKVYSMNKDNL